MPELLKDKFCKGKDPKKHIKEMREKILKAREDKLAEWRKSYAEHIMKNCGAAIEKLSAGQEDEIHKNLNCMRFASTYCDWCKKEFGDEVAKEMVQSVGRECKDALVSMGFRTVKVQVYEYTF